MYNQPLSSQDFTPMECKKDDVLCSGLHDLYLLKNVQYYNFYALNYVLM